MSLLSVSLPPEHRSEQQAPHHGWGELHGASKALAIANALSEQVNSGNRRPIVIVTETMHAAQRLATEIPLFTKGTIKLQVFPDWETLPYDHFSPHQDIVSQRLETLYNLTQNRVDCLLLPIKTLLQRLAPQSYLANYALFLKRGQQLDVDAFRRQLEQAGYLHVSQVMSHSEFSVRGSIIDLYPMGSDQPFRLDLFDDEIDTIRYFSPSDQRSGDAVDAIKLLPAREFPTDANALSVFRQQYLDAFPDYTSKDSAFASITKGMMPGGVEYYLPLFFTNTDTIFDYLPKHTVLLLDEDLQGSSERFWQDLTHRYEQYRHNVERPLLPPDTLYLPPQDCFAACKAFARISVQQNPTKQKGGRSNFACKALPDIAIDHASKTPFAPLKAFLDSLGASTRVVFCAETQGRKETLLQLLNKAQFRPLSIGRFEDAFSCDSLHSVMVGRIEHSFYVKQGKQHLVFITETELLGHQITLRRRRDKRQATDEGAIIRNLAELTAGQPIVHIDHGVGRFLGLEIIAAGEVETEFMAIEYAKGAKLYVPVASLHAISRYSGGDPEHAPLHALGSDAWSKAKEKAAKKVRDVAAELLNVYAQRAAKPGHAHHIEWPAYQEFAKSFPYDETPDQAHAVLHDMGSPSAMDRLVCGDVGFGKTEVAMRAAFIAAHQGKQVAILVPTTLLAQQHYENFINRFSDWPFNIQVLSRFSSAKEQKQTLAQITSGQADIVVGTHKLLSADVKFADLGLVIIDEEHRFGVRQKDKFKALRADVDILTLTATPIPRTLNMAMSGMRDLSIIATPPAKRLPIKTFVMQRKLDIIREAIMREILRGGQVYFLHNDIASIERVREELAEILPEVKVAVGHGQMKERELENIMDDFYHQRYQVLLCTTIIETGIDIPSANTIIMDRADHLGLAQLHQLRGRVGRSHHQAYAYLLTPHPRRMTKDAAKRLEAISSLEDLGAGFALATHDLEIRGAGELLGDGQSGQIASIGFSLYMDMLDKAVKAIKDGKEPQLTESVHDDSEIELRIPALLPDDYIGDVNTRLSVYKRLASCSDHLSIDELQVELIDRFGLLPEPAKHLFALANCKLIARQIGIKKIEANAKGGMVEFTQDAKIDPSWLIKLVQSQANVYQFGGPTKLNVQQAAPYAAQRVAWVEQLLLSFYEEGLAA
jgi:transcription-repair coupling factor (superfamily II helicase)